MIPSSETRMLREPRFPTWWAGVPILLAVAACTPTEPATPTVASDSLIDFEDTAWVQLARECTPLSSTAGIQEAPRASFEELSTEHWSLREQFTALADAVPGGFGGLYFRGGEQMVVALVDPVRWEEARGALDDLLPEVGLEAVLPSLSNSDVVIARWDFRQLYDWFHHLAPELQGRVPGIHQRAISETSNRIEYGVDEEGEIGALGHVLDELGAPCWLVAAEVRPRVGGGG